MAATSADSSSRMRPSSSSTADLGLAPGVAQLHDDERLHEQRLAAARRVVDDALDLAPRLGPDRDDVAAVAQRDDRLLERAAELRADERVEAPAQAVVGDPHGRPQRTRAAATRCRAARRPGRSCAPACCAAPAAGGGGGRGRGAAAGAPPRAPSARRAAASSVSAISRNWFGSRRPPRAARPTHGSMSCAAPIPTPGPLLEQLPGLVGLVEAARDDDRVRRRLERLREAARRIERRLLREAGPDRRELEQRDRARVHAVLHRQARRRLSDGLPGTVKRHGTEAQGSPA